MEYHGKQIIILSVKSQVIADVIICDCKLG